MREIGYRAWLKKDKKMVEVKSIHFGTKKIVYSVKENSDRWGFLTSKFDEIELMQFTGLTDTNGKQILENDLCYFFDSNCGEDEILKVVYEDGGYWLRGDGWAVSFSQINTNTDVEVIGNIYDNPELLEAK